MAGSPKLSGPSSGQPPPETTKTQSSKSSADILVGEVVRPHGVRGELLVHVLSENPKRFSRGAQLHAGKTPAEAHALKVSSTRPHANGLLVSFEAVTTRDDAERLRGALLFVDAETVPPPEQGSWWESELIGMKVEDEAGVELGEVTGIVTAPRQDHWEVTTSTGVVQVPAVDDIVKSVDRTRRLIVLDPPAGLFE